MQRRRCDDTLGFPGEGPAAPDGARLRASRPRKCPAPRAGAAEVQTSNQLDLEHADERRGQRDEKRRRYAWQIARQKPDSSGIEMERLLVHSVTDDSALKLYLPALQQFITFKENHGMPADTWPKIDLSLTAYMTTLCYSRDQHFAADSMTINGPCYLVPELTQMLPRAWRSLRAWERPTIAKEGGPMAPQALVCMSSWLLEQQRPDAACAGDMIETALDTYAREQDVVNLRVCDIMDDPEADIMMLKFGASHRGESSKTGRSQGVRIDWPHTRRLLRRQCSGKKPGSTPLPTANGGTEPVTQCLDPQPRAHRTQPATRARQGTWPSSTAASTRFNAANAGRRQAAFNATPRLTPSWSPCCTSPRP